MGNDDQREPGKLIDDIIQYLERERELFGDFGRSSPSSENPVDDAGDAEAEAADPQPEPAAGGNTEEQDAADRDELFQPREVPEEYQQLEECGTLEELEALCAGSDLLKTDLEGTNLVFGVGNPEADLVLVGEAPGEQEDKQGEPFVGKAGQLLNKILNAIGFEREDVYIANILKHRPPNNRDPKPEERQRSLPFLLCQIDLVDPKLICCLGKVSAQTLLDNDLPLTRMRGTFHPFRGKYELLVTFHPAALLYHPKWKKPTWEDVQMLRERYDELGGKP